MTYDCVNDNCVFETTSGYPYYICSTCYHRPIDSTDDTEDDMKGAADNQTDFIYRKFQSSMKAIS